ncbi:MAG: SDR family oxidoreductase [Gemmatimonadaceae bacterium]
MTAPSSGFSLTGRVAVVTGASGLLGGHFASALAESGADVVLVDVRTEPADERARAISEVTGRRVVAAAGDVRRRDSLEEVLRTTLEQFGRVDVLVNNAALTNSTRSNSYGAAFEDFPREDWDAILGTNLTGVLHGCQVFGRQMLRAGGGSIVNVASMYGVVSPTHILYEGSGVLQPVAYSVSKAGVIALTRYLGALWARRGVRVNCISPGGVFSDQSATFLERYSAHSPIGRMADPQEMQGALLYLASDASRYCAGHNLVVDGGWTAW